MDASDLTFRERPGGRIAPRARRRSSLPWLLVAAIAAILFVFVVRTLLERTSWTADASSQSGTQGIETTDAPPAVPDAPSVEAHAMPMVYRCVDRAGAVSFQSEPCGPGQRTTRAIPAPPEREPVRSRPSARTVPGTQSAYTFAPPRVDPLAARKASCAAARQQRTATLERVGLKRTYDLLQRLDARVNAACAGL